jgi:SOS-response transcriptional repressor LexA
MSNIEDITKRNLESILDDGETFVLSVTGRSMLPLLGRGDSKIILRRVSKDEDIYGRIAMFRATIGHIVIHRVIRIEGDDVILKGDGNIVQEERCSRGEIIAVVEQVLYSNGDIVECNSWQWRVKEQIWLSTPLFIRRYVLALMHRWYDRKQNKR